MGSLNCWEGYPPKFLSKAFEGDLSDISSLVSSLEKPTVLELGFGNNKVLKYLLTNLPPNSFIFYGFDKTNTFLERAKSLESEGLILFNRLDVTRTKLLRMTLEDIRPDILILRHLIEHLPLWNIFLRCINKYGPEYLVVSLFTKAETTKSEITEGFTFNYISFNDLDKKLCAYKVIHRKTYKRSNHSLHFYKRSI